jgi:hypothetical protein
MGGDGVGDGLHFVVRLPAQDLPCLICGEGGVVKTVCLSLFSCHVVQQCRCPYDLKGGPFCLPDAFRQRQYP